MYESIVFGLTVLVVRGKRYRVSYDVWSGIVGRLGEDASEIVVEVDRMRGRLEGFIGGFSKQLFMDGEGLFSVSRLLDDFSRLFIHCPTGGVDSSTTPPIRLVNYFYSIVSSSAVIYGEGRRREPVFKVFVESARAPDLADPSYARVELYLRMFDVELEALRYAVSHLIDLASEGNCTPVLFLDGPIVDPPSFLATASRAGEKFREHYLSYVGERAKQVLKIIGAGGIVVGFVKRVYGNMFTSHLVESNDKLREFISGYKVSDFSLVSLSRDIVAESFCNQDRDYLLAFSDFSLPRDLVDVELYREKGLEVRTLYIIPRLCGNIVDSKPARIEVALEASKAGSRDYVREAIRKALVVVAGWHVPATSIPEPVLLAHRRCTIRRREARKILRELATRFIEREAARENPSRAAYIAKTFIS